MDDGNLSRDQRVIELHTSLTYAMHTQFTITWFIEKEMFTRKNSHKKEKYLNQKERNTPMKNSILATLTIVSIITCFPLSSRANGGGKNVKLHVDPRWKECSFKLDASLTQNAWREFTREAGLVAYFRPLKDAKPMGVGNYELSFLRWNTSFDDTRDAWNNTFVHPDSTHWLKDGSQLPIPGFSFRTAIADNVDVGAYWTTSPGSNYGFWGGQVQYGFVNDISNDWAASARFGFVSLYGPDDLNFSIYGLDVLASKGFDIYSDWISASTYAGISTYLSMSHETSNAVNLQDEEVVGVQGMVGGEVKISMARLAIEYNIATVNTLSFKIGIGF